MFLMSDMLQLDRNVPSRPAKIPHVPDRLADETSVWKYASLLPTFKSRAAFDVCKGK